MKSLLVAFLTLAGQGGSLRPAGVEESVNLRRVQGIVSDRSVQGSYTIHLVPRNLRLNNVGIPGSSVDSKTGAFEIQNVPRGEYLLKASLRPDDASAPSFASLPVSVYDKDLEGVILTFQPGGKVTADVIIEGQDVNSPDIKRLKLSVDGVPGVQSPLEPGLFTFANVPPGNAPFSVRQLPEDSYVKSARMGPVDVLAEGITIGGSNGPLHVNVVIGAGAILEGLVMNEKGDRLSNVTVAIVPDASRRQISEYFKSGSTDARGQFRITGIAPGDYAVFAWEDVEEGAWMDPNFLRSYEDRGMAMHATEATRANLQLQALRPLR